MQRALSILGWIGTALVFGAVAVRALRPEWDQYAVYGAWAGIALVAVYALGQWREVAAQLRTRQARYATLASASVIIVLGLLVAVNYLSARRNKRWDLTANQQYTLSDQTIKLLHQLDAPATFRVFDKSTEFERFRPRLTEYQYQSKNVSIEYIDPDQKPVEAKQYDVTSYGTVVIEYKGHTERVTSDAEQDLTNGLIKVVNPQEKKVYFLSGHGEKDPAGADRDGYNAIAGALKQDNYGFDKLVLAQTNAIPADATAIIIAGPQTDLLETEVTLLDEYLKKAGKLLVLLDPSDNIKQPVTMPRIEALLREWGMNPTESVVVDLSGRTTVATVPVAAPPYPPHPITDTFGLVTMFPLARAITPLAGAAHPAQSFVQTAERSWGETDLATLETPDKLAADPDKGDIPGPVSIAVAVSVPTGGDAAPAANADAGAGDEPKKPETRVVAFGDSDFASNAYLGIQGNRDLFMNTVNWLVQQENLISIRPREASDRRITLTANSTFGLFMLSIVLIPAAVFGAGILSWWRRR